MAGTHGDLFSEIGKLAVGAHEGEPIDLRQVSEDLAARYINLGLAAETIQRAITRTMGAVGVSLALVRTGEHIAARVDASGLDVAPAVPALPADETEDDAPKSPAALFPSGVRLALLS